MAFLKNKLAKAPLPVLAGYACLIIFLLYTCCYAYRKPFTIGLYEDQTFLGFDFKLLLVLFEIIGYALSKFIGTVILPGMKKQQRPYYIIALLTFSELSWLGFGWLPPSLKIISVFFSGLPLGMIWGVVFSYIEGRRISEVLNIGLSIALIISSGLVKTLGQHVLNVTGVSEFWMPAATGAMVYPFMLLCVWLLSQIPEPDEKDKVMRTERLPMNKEEKRSFLKNYLPGICLLVVLYGSLTVFRELRDSFAADLWKELGVKDTMIYTTTEYPIAFIVLGMMFACVFIRNNRKALNTIYAISFAGGIVSIVSTWMYVRGMMNPIWWMTVSGLGMYMGYIPFTYLIERLIASLKITSTAVFLIYIADSCGYLGTAGVFMYKNFTPHELAWSDLLIWTAVISSVISLLSIVGSYFYFNKKFNTIDIIHEKD